MRPLVLCYHAVSDTWPHQLSVSPEALEGQLSLLLRNGYRPVDAAGAVTGDGQAPPRHVRRRVHERPECAAGPRAARGAGDGLRLQRLRRRPAAARRPRARRRPAGPRRGAANDELGRAARSREAGHRRRVAHGVAPAPALAFRRRARRGARRFEAPPRGGAGAAVSVPRLPVRRLRRPRPLGCARGRLRGGLRTPRRSDRPRPVSTSSASASGTETARARSPSRPGLRCARRSRCASAGLWA